MELLHSKVFLMKVSASASDDLNVFDGYISGILEL